MGDKVKVIVIEDDPDFIYLIRNIIKGDDRLVYLGDAENAISGVSLAHKRSPDIALVDLSLTPNELDGIAAAKEIRLSMNTKILLLTSFEQPDIITEASRTAFASGYIFKSQRENLTDTIYHTATSITPQEQFIRELLIKELSQAEKSVLYWLIAGDKSLPPPSAPRTIANQKGSIFKKLGLKSTEELFRVFRSRS